MFSKHYKFHKYFLKYIYLFWYTITCNFFAVIYIYIILDKFKNTISLPFDFFMFWPTIIYKNIVKPFFKMTRLIFKHEHPCKIVWCDYIIIPSPLCAFTPTHNILSYQIPTQNLCNLFPSKRAWKCILLELCLKLFFSNTIFMSLFSILSLPISIPFLFNWNLIQFLNEIYLNWNSIHLNWNQISFNVFEFNSI